MLHLLEDFTQLEQWYTSAGAVFLSENLFFMGCLKELQTL